MIERATDRFERKQRRCLELFDLPGLFSSTPKMSIAVVATPVNGHKFRMNEEHRLCPRGEDILILSGVKVVGKIDEPPQSILDTMQRTGAIGVGRVVSMFAFTTKAELTLE